MADLQVVAVITAKSGSEQLVGDALNALVEPTRAEPGCLSYHLFESAADPTAFITVVVSGAMKNVAPMPSTSTAGKYVVQ